MIMAKNGNTASEEIPSEDNVLLQLSTEEKHKIGHKAATSQKSRSDDFDAGNVDDLMKQYDEKEKVEQ